MSLRRIVVIIILPVLLMYIYNFNEKNNNNPYFFNGNEVIVTYKGYFIPVSGNEIEQDIDLNITLLEKNKFGKLYKIELSQLKTQNQDDKISMGRRYLGYFFVTKNKIFRKKLSINENFSEQEIEAIIKIMKKDFVTFLKEFDIVCNENGIEDIIYDNEWHRYIEVDGDKRIFYFYSDYLSGTRYYEKIIWQKNKGIIYYKSGEGSMLMHVEFGYELEQIKTNKVNSKLN